MKIYYSLPINWYVATEAKLGPFLPFSCINTDWESQRLFLLFKCIHRTINIILHNNEQNNTC